MQNKRINMCQAKRRADKRDKAVVDGDTEDRISSLPNGIIDCILEHLPTKEAARTCVLSKRWRYCWTMHPNLVLDYFNDFSNSMDDDSNSTDDDSNNTDDYSHITEAVDEILLLHMGNIVKFVLDLSRVYNLRRYKREVDRWMLSVTRKGLKKLTLRFYEPGSFQYDLSHCIFNCPTLTELNATKCWFRPPTSFLGFQNLVTLCLEIVTFGSNSEFCVIKAPLLAKLTLKHCRGMDYLNIVSSRLNFLCARNFLLAPNCFVNCNNLSVLELKFDRVPDDSKCDGRSMLEKLLVSSPSLDVLKLSSPLVELLSADVVPTSFPFMLNCLRHLSLYIDLGKLDSISRTLLLIKSSPNLCELHIGVNMQMDSEDEAILKYLDTPSCLDKSLVKLEYATIEFFQSSKTELLFIKLLLSRSPSLLRMHIEPYEFLGEKDIAVTRKMDIMSELMRFPRASPRAELLYIPHKRNLSQYN